MSHVAQVREGFTTVPSKDLNFTLCGLTEPSNDSHQCRLAGAILPTQNVEPPGFQLKRNTSQRSRAPVDLGDVLDLNRRSVVAQRSLSIPWNWPGQY